MYARMSVCACSCVCAHMHFGGVGVFRDSGTVKEEQNNHNIQNNSSNPVGKQPVLATHRHKRPHLIWSTD